MGDAVRETQHIKPMSRHNGLALTVAGLILMPVVLAVGYWLDGQARLVLVFLFLACMIMSILGALKLREPRYSFSLSAEHLHFHHKIGGWSLHWSNIIRIDQARLHSGLNLEELPYIGIKIRDYDELLPLMTPRMVVHLLTEQRPLLAMALRHGAISRYELQEWLVEDSHYRSSKGQDYQGLAAMLGHRMTHLRDLYGYDLLIHESSLDRDAPEFVTLLRSYLNP
ncbi:hypothetical protein GCM10011502_21540 [Oceanisphaera marina]|uniref:DUF2982 domain-containing protein n=1 Tax=Oceanisphaera marina TaxID=2017550 RepID=A0ABQ1INW8_9GAMM|nr:hypothetical protein GCM10011502_21540 [Oceanisphaera marina]